MALSEGEIEKLGSLKSEDATVKDTGLPEASYAPNTGMDYSQFYGSPLMVQQPGMDYYKSFEPQAPMPNAAEIAPVDEPGESLIDLPSLLGNTPTDTSSLIPGLITDNIPQVRKGRSRSGPRGRNRK